MMRSLVDYSDDDDGPPDDDGQGGRGQRTAGAPAQPVATAAPIAYATLTGHTYRGPAMHLAIRMQQQREQTERAAEEDRERKVEIAEAEELAALDTHELFLNGHSHWEARKRDKADAANGGLVELDPEKQRAIEEWAAERLRKKAVALEVAQKNMAYRFASLDESRLEGAVANEKSAEEESRRRIRKRAKMDSEAKLASQAAKYLRESASRGSREGSVASNKKRSSRAESRS